jgi:Zn finger protein HypA/HybF involved in hydrogenase expression
MQHVSLPNLRPVRYKGGISLVARKDKPTHQCTRCYKPWWPENLRPVFSESCPNCFGQLRRLTKDDPLITE